MSHEALPTPPKEPPFLDKIEYHRGDFVKATPGFIARFSDVTTNHPEFKELLDGGVAFITNVILPSIYVGPNSRYIALNPNDMVIIPDCKISPSRIAERDTYLQEKARETLELSLLSIGEIGLRFS